MKKYRCRSEFQHDNQPFAEEEIKLQIISAVENPDYKIADFKCVSSEKAKGDDVFTDDYTFVFEFDIEIPEGSGTDINKILENVDSGSLLGVVEAERGIKPGLDKLISGAEQKVEEKRSWMEEKRDELSEKPRSEWTEEDWEAHNYCETVTAEADYYDSLDDR